MCRLDGLHKSCNITHVVWTVAELGRAQRWDAGRIAALPGRCRGDLVGPWGRNVERRFGAAALARVRARLSEPVAALPDVLGAADWVPAGAPIVLTEAIADEAFGGDLAAMYPAVLEDTRAGIGRVRALAVRAIGPARALATTPKSVAGVYDRGAGEIAVEGRRARITFTGHPLFQNPTWRLLQLFATRVLLELAGAPGDAEGEDVGQDAFRAVARW